MGVKIILIGAAVVAAILIYYRPFGSLFIVKNKCTASAEGRFVYWEGYYQADMPGTGELLSVPVYEYTVGDKTYMTIIEGMTQRYNVFPLKVEVLYNPSSPEVCFINGKRGKVINKK